MDVNYANRKATNEAEVLKIILAIVQSAFTREPGASPLRISVCVSSSRHLASEAAQICSVYLIMDQIEQFTTRALNLCFKKNVLLQCLKSSLFSQRSRQSHNI